MNAPWLILRSLRMSDQRRAAWTGDLQALGIETYYPMVRQNMRVPKNKLTPSQRNSEVSLMRPRVVPLFPSSTFVRGPDVSGILEDKPLPKNPQIGIVPLGTALPRLPDVAIVEMKRRDVASMAVGFLAIGEEYTKVPHEEIADLKRRELDGVIPGASSAEWKFDKGEVVWIVDGVFTGRRGVVEVPPGCPLEEVDSYTKLTVALDLFGRQTPVELTVGDVRKV